MSYKGDAPYLEEEDQKIVLEWISKNTHNPEKSRAMFLLSTAAGMRAVEISGLDWYMVLDSRGNVRKNEVDVPASISKGGYGERKIHVPDILTDAISDHYKRSFTHPQKPIFVSERSKTRLSANCICQWFLNTYLSAGIRCKGMNGYSSHSGRRTFITNAARAISSFNLSLHDVMKMAGHARLTTTQGYIECNKDDRVAMMNSIYNKYSK